MAQSFTEFFCDASGGSNINAGDKTANGVVTSTNGDWDNATANRFTAAAGTPFSGVSVGDFASVYLDGATLAVYIARVTAVNGGGASLDLSTTAISGTKPTAGATGRSCTTGGAWKGPNGTETFPSAFITAALTNSSTHPPRVNFKNGTSYDVTTPMTFTQSGPLKFQGYTSTPGDGGRAVFRGPASGASINILSSSNTDCHFEDMEITRNGDSGTTAAVSFLQTECLAKRLVVHDVYASGFSATAAITLVECEAYACVTGNGTNSAGFFTSGAGSHLIRCIAHDNTGSNVAGFRSGGTVIRHTGCIAESNGANGFEWSTTTNPGSYLNCDSYNNGGAGFSLVATTTVAGAFYLENCNILKNTLWGVDTGTTNKVTGVIINCGFGSGTQANGSGTIHTGTGWMVEDSGTITYAADTTPWVDPANGDFRINLTAAKGTGRGAFLQTAASYAGAVAYPDVGACQHQETGGGGGSSRLIGNPGIIL